MKPTTAITWLLTLIILTLSPRGYAQNRQDATDEDPGVDVAVVISIRANLRGAA